MDKKTYISIARPCQEDWNQMTAHDKSRFCAGCQKQVHDFTKASDREILERFTAEKNLCGRFLDTQLNRGLVVRKEKSQIWIAAASGALAFLGIGTHTVHAQDKDKTVQTDQKPSMKATMQANREMEFSGTISDQTDTLPGVEVTVKGTETKAMSDFDGNFRIKARENDVLVFSFIGLETLEVVAHENTKLNIKLKQNDEFYSKVIRVGGAMAMKKRTYAGRTIHAVSNLFRKKENRRSNLYRNW